MKRDFKTTVSYHLPIEIVKEIERKYENSGKSRSEIAGQALKRGLNL